MNYKFILTTFIFLLLTFRHLYLSNKYKKLIKLFLTPAWLISFIIIVIWCIYVFHFYNENDKEKIKESTKKAIIGFIIAILSSLDISTTVFWLIFIVSYYLSD